MEKFVIAILIVAFGGPCLAAQAELKDWRKDPRLVAWAASLPPAWSLSLEGDRLTASSDRPIWVLSENKVNAPLSRETPGQRSARIQKFGQRGHASFSLRLSPKRPVSLRWSPQSPPDYLSDFFELRIGPIVGMENELVSVDPPSVGGEVAALRGKLKECLIQPLRPGQALADYEGRTIAILAARAREYNQHSTASNPDFPYSTYIDWGDDQLLAYSRQALGGPGPWELVGRVIAVGGDRSDLRAKEAPREYHLLVLADPALP